MLQKLRQIEQLKQLQAEGKKLEANQVIVMTIAAVYLPCLGACPHSVQIEKLKTEQALLEEIEKLDLS